MKNIKLILCFGLALTLFGCSSPKKAELSFSSSPKAAVYEVVVLNNKTKQAQFDLLSFKQYMKGSEYLKRAQRALSRGSKDEVILDNAAKAKAYFQEAAEQSRSRSSTPFRILQARKASLEAGIRNSETLTAALLKVDRGLRSDTGNFSKTLDPDEFSEFQMEYFSLEIKAVQFRELDNVKKAIRKATKKNAEDRAPNTLRTAMLDLNEAENFIAQSPRNPGVHKKSVNKAVASSVLLLDVMDVILNAKGTPENIALKIVNQNRALGILSKNVGSLEKNLQTAKSDLSQTEGVLKRQNEKLKKSSTQVRFQEAMEEAGKHFSEDEASVYQQGNKLIFRLKKINFASGVSTVPPASKQLLSKVNDIITALEAELVAVQGHTDSIGAADLNSKLSTKRANSVAIYLSSLAGGYKIGYIGYGESRPIASNETNVGRAINRRVDLVVTAKK
jgi:outer membrane protein OmpA-like peptidoglycan-associated protein